MLFHLQSPEDVTSQISEQAIAAAITFVGICCQQRAFVAGRGDIREEIKIIKASSAIRVNITQFLCMCDTGIMDTPTEEPQETHSTQAQSLRLPGRRLNSTTICKETFRIMGIKNEL